MPGVSTLASVTAAPLLPPVDGLVWGYRFNDDGRADPLDGAAAMLELERQESWVWLHFDLIDGRARKALANLAHIPDEARELLLGVDDRQRMETYGQVIAGVVMDFERADELDPRRMLSWRFCMAPHAFISARRSPLQTMAELHNAILSGRRFPDVLHLFNGIIHSFAGALGAVSVRMVGQLDEVEDGLLDERDSGDFESLGSVRRKAVQLHRQATPLRFMLHSLLAERPDWFTEDAAEDSAQVAHRVDSVCADLVALQERARALQDELNSRQTEMTNKRLMLLSIISAVLLPPTLISGIFGMNVDGLPFTHTPFGFLCTIGVMVFSVIGLLFVLRRMKMF
ncbi:CorA family divalent cation transporter [Acidisoma sp. L85]|jgi:zinc transporter|uniref:CorA family divalent cation transporter n=1 Tax=Acidisoma sp. L85 TaxID=1641850 RepID=UPI00131C1483|nr:CorA family divalent cation transporter [Acidisoma sp. L85]